MFLAAILKSHTDAEGANANAAAGDNVDAAADAEDITRTWPSFVPPKVRGFVESGSEETSYSRSRWT